ncbi:MAG: sigma-E factor negative regulatory protein [Sutterellaceae bacterium]|nr:sigma-E factor negative regulatory protein [Burkholderiaceae bacterium]MCX7900958.1 sigma-E factor negative regulatory protein [Burkholderiaceae bacterium]MDW8429817.1 sigma-E factor negative regulatory protein [Sutterellaceae bacterium]
MSDKMDRGVAPDSQCREALSRLIDGEVDEAECRRLLARLAADETACREWALMNAACDALRSSEVAAFHSSTFVARMRTALEAEPALLVARAPMRRRPRLLWLALPAAAFAAAAGVLAVIALPLLRSPAPVPAELARQTLPAAMPASATGPGPTAGQVDAIVRSAELEAYLEAHREQAAGPVLPRPSAYQRASATLAAPQR